MVNAVSASPVPSPATGLPGGSPSGSSLPPPSVPPTNQAIPAVLSKPPAPAAPASAPVQAKPNGAVAPTPPPVPAPVAAPVSPPNSTGSPAQPFSARFSAITQAKPVSPMPGGFTPPASAPMNKNSTMATAPTNSFGSTTSAVPPTGQTAQAASDPTKKHIKISLPIAIGALALLLLVIGGAVAYYLSLQNQEIRQQASSGYNCPVGFTETGSGCVETSSLSGSQTPTASSVAAGQGATQFANPPTAGTCANGTIPVYSNGIAIGCSTSTTPSSQNVSFQGTCPSGTSPVTSNGITIGCSGTSLATVSQNVSSNGSCPLGTTPVQSNGITIGCSAPGPTIISQNLSSDGSCAAGTTPVYSNGIAIGCSAISPTVVATTSSTSATSNLTNTPNTPSTLSNLTSTSTSPSDTSNSSSSSPSSSSSESGTNNSQCGDQVPVNTQFRSSGNGSWISGADMTTANYQVGQSIDVNCFAKNGTASLTGGYIMMTDPSGATTQVSSSPSFSNYKVTTAGQYTFTCKSTTLTTCSDADSFTIAASSGVTTTPTGTTTPTTCNSSCNTDAQCQAINSNYVCYNKTCRLATTTGDASCGQTTTTSTSTSTTTDSSRTTVVNNGPAPVTGQTEDTILVVMAGAALLMSGKIFWNRRDLWLHQD